MANLNQVTVIGRLGDSPVAGDTRNGKRYMRLSVATNQGYGDKKKTVWWNVIVWNSNIVENLESKLTKGMQVYVQGSLEQDEYDGKPTFQIVVAFGGEILMLDSVREKSGDNEITPTISSDDDIPF